MQKVDNATAFRVLYDAKITAVDAADVDIVQCNLGGLVVNYAAKSPLVTMGRLKFTPKLPLLLRRSPLPSNTPIPRPTPLNTPNGIRIRSAVLPQYTLRTDRPTDRWSRRMFHNMSRLRSLDRSDAANNYQAFRERTGNTDLRIAHVTNLFVWPHLDKPRSICTECDVIGRSHANWVASRRTTRFAVAATNDSRTQFGWNEVSWDEVRRSWVRLVISSWYEQCIILKLLD